MVALNCCTLSILILHVKLVELNEIFDVTAKLFVKKESIIILSILINLSRNMSLKIGP